MICGIGNSENVVSYEEEDEEDRDFEAILSPAIHSGVRFNYYTLCKRKFWLFSHHINFEHGNENVAIGKLLHKTAYSRKTHEVSIGQGIKIDFISTSNGIEIHEIKKSKKMEKSHKMQMLFYLWYLDKHGIKAKGYIDYPEQRRRTEVILNDEGKKEVEDAIEKMDFAYNSSCPMPIRTKVCSSCAYEDYCFCEGGK